MQLQPVVSCIFLYNSSSPKNQVKALTFFWNIYQDICAKGQNHHEARALCWNVFTSAVCTWPVKGKEKHGLVNLQTGIVPNLAAYLVCDHKLNS